MSIRPLSVSILIFIFMIIGIYEIYLKVQEPHSVYRISSNQQWIGVIDMNNDHGINIRDILKGQDILLVADSANPFFQEQLRKNKPMNKATDLNRFEISYHDTNSDGVLNEENPKYRYLRIIHFNPNNQGYEIRSLTSVGIRGIKIGRLNPYENPEAIMSDGSTRPLYEINNSRGSSMYKNSTNKVVTYFQENTSP